MKKAIVTGASGFIGMSLVKELLTQNMYVYAFVRNTNQFKKISSNNLKVIVLEGEDYLNIPRFVESDVTDFYHLAWSGVSSSDYHSTEIQLKNIRIATCAIQAAMDIGCNKVIFIGSGHQYLSARNEDNAIINIGVYGACKKAAGIIMSAMAVDKIKFNMIIFNNVFGPLDYSNRATSSIISKMLRNEDIALIEGDNLYDWIFIDDAVRGIICIAERGKNQKEYYLGSQKLITFASGIKRVRDILHSESKLQFGTYKDKSFVNYEQIDLQGLYNDTGFVCECDFTQSILKTAKWILSINKKD